MTFSELERAIASKKRVMKIEAQEKASADYILADLIGRSVARIYHSSNELPDISKVYPALFNDEAIQKQKEDRKAELSAIRFKQFANSFNKRFKGD